MVMLVREKGQAVMATTLGDGPRNYVATRFEWVRTPREYGANLARRRNRGANPPRAEFATGA